MQYDFGYTGRGGSTQALVKLTRERLMNSEPLHGKLRTNFRSAFELLYRTQTTSPLNLFSRLRSPPLRKSMQIALFGKYKEVEDHIRSSVSIRKGVAGFSRV